MSNTIKENNLEDFVVSDELINIWLKERFLSKGKTSPEQLTAEEIQEEIEEMRGTISNERLWAQTDAIHWENVANLEAYISRLKKFLEEAEKRNSTASGQGWRIVMVSEGGTKHHFIGGFKSEEEANNAAESYNWHFVDDNRFKWRLEVEEDNSTGEEFPQ